MKLRWSALVGWGILASLLSALLLGALTFDRRQWPQLVGDEAAYLMQAESLAYDFDIGYSRADYDRFLDTWQRRPDGLILQSPDGGQSFVYGKPVFYSAYLAPFVRLAPVRGPLVANVLLLALAALLAAQTLSPRLGPLAAPLWVAVFVFGSVTFAHVFWVHADLFLMSCSAIALALAYRGRADAAWAMDELPDVYQPPGELSGRAFMLRWLAVGALLAIVAVSRPFYAALLLPAFLAVPRGLAVSGEHVHGSRRQGRMALLVGAAVVIVLSVGVNLMVRGTWTSYGGERQGFYDYTGFPGVDYPEGAWRRGVEERGGSWTQPGSLVPDVETAQLRWNVVYFLLGRDVGVLPYFLPLLLGLLAFRPQRGRWALLLAVALAVACFLLVRPFNFYGGGGALANRYFLPLYPAFWFLVVGVPGRASEEHNHAWRQGSPSWQRGNGGTAVSLAIAAALLAAPFLYPTWQHPRAFLRDASGGYAYVSAQARAWLPYETTQSHLKPSGQEDFLHNGLWIKLLDTSLNTEGQSVNSDGSTQAARLRLASGTSGALLIGSAQPLESLYLRLEPPGSSRLSVKGGVVGDTVYLATGGTGFQIYLQEPRARHRMWWLQGDRLADGVYLYQLELAMPEDAPKTSDGFRFQLEAGFGPVP